MPEKHTIEFIREQFEKRGWTLLSTEYKDNKSKLDYICDKGHKNEIQYSVFSKVGCSICNGCKKPTIDFIRSEFEKEEYTLLSTKYVNSKSKLDFICNNGHKHYIRWNEFKIGQRCGKCNTNNTRHSYDYIKEHFEKRGYTLLTTEYKRCSQKLEYICDKGHNNFITWNDFRSGAGCFDCAVINRADNHRLSYDFVKSEFEKEGYTLLTTEYRDAHQKLEYICPNNHKHSIQWAGWSQGHRCGKCYKVSSRAELEIYDLVKSYFLDTISGDKKLISPLELDIVVPSKKIAIEYGGLFWHSELQGKDRNYHLNKLQKCNEIGYKLITIFEDEWLNKQDIVENRLKHILGISDSASIYARKCVIKEIDTKAKNLFLEKFHLQGKDYSKVKLGAFYNNSLVSVMTFSGGSIAKGNVAKEGVYELNRFCSDYDYNVVGIAGKFVSHFRKNYTVDNIFTYGDRRWSDGDLYKKLGFEFVHKSDPSYWYIVDNKRIHRFNFRKGVLDKKLEFYDPDLTEWDNMINNGYNRIWDCGNVKWILENERRI